MQQTPPPDAYSTRKRKSSWNNSEDNNASPRPHSSPNQTSVATPSSSKNQNGAASQTQNQRQFRQWASMLIDRTRMRLQQTTNGGGGMLSRIPSASSPKSRNGKKSDNKKSAKQRSPAETRSPEERSTNSKVLDPSVYFMSNPSISEEEETDIGSSQADYNKKLLYRQKLRGFDAVSVGDTSLSSSNISPTPQRFRIQFESSSGQIKSNIGKMRNKLKAAARLSFSSMMQSETSNGRTEAEENGGCPLDGTTEDMLQAPTKWELW